MFGRKIIACLVLSAPALTGCSTVFKEKIDDAKFADIKLIDANDAPSGMDKMPPQHDRRVLLVTISTRRDVEAAVKEHDIVAVHADILSCDRKEKLSWSGVYPVPQGFQVWFDYYSLVHFSDDYAKYDLRNDPRDLCVSISGNPYLGIGVGIESKGVVVPKQAIADVLSGTQ